MKPTRSSLRSDERFMREAIALARRAEGLTSPNPIVGAVIVKDGRIVGAGYHKRCGLVHAEINAIADAGSLVRGAALYVTLEPCGHYGRTPPCTEAIIRSRIQNVVAAMKDPNPINNGKGIRALRRAGITVRLGILGKEAEAINRPYLKMISKRMPYVTLKLAESLDGRIATRTGDSKWITSEASRSMARAIRGKVDAVMVGAGTVIADDPMLLGPSAARQPVRIIVDGRLKVPVKRRIFFSAKRSAVVIATYPDAPAAKIRALEKKGVSFIFVNKARSGRLDLKDLLKKIVATGINHIMAEGGGELAAGLIEARLVDKFIFFIAPKIIGGRDAVPSVGGRGAGSMREAVILKNMCVKRHGPDIVIEAEA